MTINNSTFASHDIVINPSKYLGSGIAVGEVGAEIRYNALFLDTNGDNQITCSFDLELKQDGTSMYNKNNNAKKNVSSILFSDTFTV